MTAHNPHARREASAMPVVLFGDHGRTVEGYRPADMDLDLALPAMRHRRGVVVVGPHLRTARPTNPRNITGVVGVSYGRDRSTGRNLFRCES